MDHNQPPYDSERLLEIADAVFDGTAAAEEVAQLEKMLRNDADARAVYLRFALVHGQLATTVPALACFEPGLPESVSGAQRNGDGAPPRPDPAPASYQRSGRLRRFAALAVALAAAMLVAASLWPGPTKRHGSSATDPKDANVAGRDVASEPPSTYYDNMYLPIETVAMVGSSASGPTTLKVARGATRFASSSGAEVRVEGPAVFGVSSRAGGILFNGSVHARLEKPDATFSVLASNLRVVDLGTEFRVTMLDDQRVRVEVLDGEVDVQSRVRLPLYYWNFDGPKTGAANRSATRGGELTFGRKARRVQGIIGSGAVHFDNTPESFVLVEHGAGTNAGTGAMTCSSGITIEAMLISRWSGAPRDYDEIFRKEDGIYRILLSLQNDDNFGSYARPEVEPGPCLSFGLHVEQQGYSELDMPLDGREGRPSLEQLTDGSPHHIAATYDSFTGKKAIYVDGRLCFEHRFPVGALILSGGPARAEIGNHGGSEPFHGTIDEVAFYDFALTPKEITSHYRNVAAGKTYFGIDAERLSLTRWQSVTRVAAGTERVFNKMTGLPL